MAGPAYNMALSIAHLHLGFISFSILYGFSQQGRGCRDKCRDAMVVSVSPMVGLRAASAARH